MGYKFDHETVMRFQKDMEAISTVHLRHLVPYSAVMKAYDKLSNRIVEHVKVSAE